MANPTLTRFSPTLNLLKQPQTESDYASSPQKSPAILDTGATGHCVTADAPFTNKRAAILGITTQLPDGSTIQSMHTCSLALPFLPAAAREANIFPFLASGSLISIGLLCGHGCTALFNARTVTIKYCIVLTGTRRQLPNYGISTSLVSFQHRHRPMLTPLRSPAQPALPMPSSITPTWQNASLFTTPPCFHPRFLLGAQPSTLATSTVGQNSRQPKFADTHHSPLPWSKGTLTKNAQMLDPQN